MSEQVTVSQDFLQKVVGFSEATNALMKSAEESREALRAAATEAVDALEKAGQLAEGTDKDKLIQGFVDKPEMALKLATSVTNEATEAAAQAAATATQKTAADAAEGNEEPSVAAASIGGAGESDDKTKRAAELVAGPAVPANMTGDKESDEVWDKGFGLS